MNCCICEKEIADGVGHNAAHLIDGRCCDSCNKAVLKYRLMTAGFCMMVAEDLMKGISKNDCDNQKT